MALRYHPKISEAISEPRIFQTIGHQIWHFFTKIVYYNENMDPNSNFKRNYLENYNDSKVVVKTKNETSFMIFPNTLFLYRIFSDWTGPLKIKKFTWVLPSSRAPAQMYFSSLYVMFNIKGLRLKFWFKNLLFETIHTIIRILYWNHIMAQSSVIYRIFFDI
jgi:hypothetical protein